MASLVYLSGDGGSCNTRPEPERGGVQPGTRAGTRAAHLQSSKQLAALAEPGAPPPGPNNRPVHPQIQTVPLIPPLSSWSSAWQPAASGHLPGLRATQRGPGSREPPPPPGPWGQGPNLRSPHPEEEEEEEGSTGSPPGQLPVASASPDSDSGRKHRLLPPSSLDPEIHSSC